MTAEMAVPAWMHTQISAEQYDSWTEEQCAGIEIVDGMVVVRPSASKRHNRLARILANALDAATGPDRNADTDFDVRLQDVPLTNRRPDVIVYRAETIDLTPTRPEHVLLVVEVVSPGTSHSAPLDGPQPVHPGAAPLPSLAGRVGTPELRRTGVALRTCAVHRRRLESVHCA
ncbi:Uma2 family endonuclease [Streptomyces pratensis]|uniref:Uma2 family endonuclease n=1 Tax=Streptomyces pratensis TaxID=1169025 RepID=UPI00363E749A